MATNNPIDQAASSHDLDRIKQILQLNRQTKQTIQKLTKDFLNVQLDFMKEIQQTLQTSFDDDNNTSDPLFPTDFDFLNNDLTSKRIQLAVCGPNSSGKTSFLHAFLKIGDILPTNVGPVSARIIKLTYARASDACLYVYESIKRGLSQEEPKTHISLDQFFQQATPDWNGIRETIAIHVARPENVSEEDFANWAKHFVEIRVPSPILEVGIDAYDTPGFLFYDKPVVKENLHELVKLIQPTLIFMYENCTVAGDAYECFLALKAALGNLKHPHVFFLNTKQDIKVLFSDAGINVSQRHLLNATKFNEILPREREKRYKLLLNVPAMVNELHRDDPTTDMCDNFDICSTPIPRSLLPQCAIEMTESSIQRIIQFTVKTDLEEFYRMADSVLITINNFFEFSLTTSHREPCQWAQIRDNALKWGKIFFQKVEQQLADLVDSAYVNILRRFDERSANISERAARLDRLSDPLESKIRQITEHGIKEFIKIAIQEEVIKVTVNEIINQTKETLQQSITHEMAINVEKNELLIAAQRQILIDISATELEQRSWFERLIFNISMIPMITSRLVKGLRIKWNVDFWDKKKSTEFYNEDEYYAYTDALDAYAHLTDPQKRKYFAETYMIKMKRKIEGQEQLFKRNLKEWVEIEKKIFFQKIESNYRLAIQRLSKRKTAYEIVKLYAGPFARIECQLLAAKDLVKFNGQLPIIDTSRTLGEGAFFTVHAAKWNDKTDLVVKKLKRPLMEYPYLQYLEAHYHRKITQLAIPNTVPLLFLFHRSSYNSDCIVDDMGNTDLWMFLPKYKQSLKDYLDKNIRTITSDKIIKIALDIGQALVKLHSNEIVHRDVKSKNILMDNSEECYLADFGTCKESTINNTVVGTLPMAPELLISREFAFSMRHEPASNYDGTAVDIYSFGVLLYELLPKPQYHRPYTNQTELNVKELLKEVSPLDSGNNDYEILIECCLAKTAKERPTALEVVQKLQEIKKNVERKTCTICETRPRKCRCYPCGHKLICDDCYNQLPRNNENKTQCILCRQVVDRWEEDDENQTFYSSA